MGSTVCAQTADRGGPCSADCAQNAAQPVKRWQLGPPEATWWTCHAGNEFLSCSSAVQSPSRLPLLQASHPTSSEVQTGGGSHVVCTYGPASTPVLKRTYLPFGSACRVAASFRTAPQPESSALMSRCELLRRSRTMSQLRGTFV